MDSPKVEQGLVVGNTYDKYGTRNPISRALMGGFLRSFDRLVARTGATRVTEVGCGEGHLAMHLARQGRAVQASDISRTMVDQARAASAAQGLDVRFEVASVYELDPAHHRNPLVVCCEVLEHLDDPDRALATVVELADPYLLLSVPREPVWRVLNVCRLHYLRDLGNTPGHVQHWSRRAFLDFVSTRATIEATASPFPWTMVLARRRP